MVTGRHFILSLFLAISILYKVNGQDIDILNKLQRDTSPRLEAVKISGNGKTSCYRIVHYDAFRSPVGIDTLVFINNKTGFKKEFPGIKYYTCKFFNNDSKVAFKLRNDSLVVLDLYSFDTTVISNVYEFNTDGCWLNYFKNSEKQTLYSSDLRSRAFKILNVSTYHFIPGNDMLIIERKRPYHDDGSSLTMFNLKTGFEFSFWEGENVGEIVFSKEGGLIAFMETFKSKPKKNLFLFYINENRARKMISDDSIKELIGFSKDNESLFYTKVLTRQKSDESPLSLYSWNYKDSKLSGEKNKEIELKSYHSLQIKTKTTISLYNSTGRSYQFDVGNANRFAVIREYQNNIDMTFLLQNSWNQQMESNDTLVNMKTGAKYFIRHNGIDQSFQPVSLSPGEKFMIYFDKANNQFVSYQTTSKVAIPVTSRNHHWTDHQSAVWISDTTAIVCDKYDIWLLDGKGEKSEYNLTRGEGEKLKIKFSAINVPTPFYKNGHILLKAFNMINKEMGFYDINCLRGYKISKLSMQQSVFLDQPEISISPLKAKRSDFFLVTKQTSQENNDIYITTDFRKFRPISRYTFPRKEFAVNAKLLSWKSADGFDCQGILYSPKDGDSAKKYPLLISPYEKLSDNINIHLDASYIKDRLNVPLLVKNGYYVLLPDVIYNNKSMASSIEGAILPITNNLIKEKWSNGKVGLYGHSFGAYEVNYLITRSSIFNAAVSASGTTDLLSAYVALRQSDDDNFSENQYQIQNGQYLMRFTPWSHLQDYLDASPLFAVENIKTPIMIMSNALDGAVAYTQGLGFFLALRRNGKAAWFLNYYTEKHSLSQRPNIEDYTEKILGFFDYYLKDGLFPKWMEVRK